MQQPKYVLGEFLKACRNDNKQLARVSLVGGVIRKAVEDFSLKTRKDLLEFIANGGLEELEFVNSIEYRLSDEIPPPFCDAYIFKSGFTQGYISFFFSEFQQKWLIKSFHKSDDCGSSIMEVALQKASEAGTLSEKFNRSK